MPKKSQGSIKLCTVFRRVARLFLLGTREGSSAIQVGPIQAVVKKSNYLTNLVVGEFEKKKKTLHNAL